MDCLHCGDCCRRMSPISNPAPCPLLIEVGSFVFCSQYEQRPKQCVDHDFPARFCPIGLDVLKLNSIDDVRHRIDDGWDIIQNQFVVLEIRR